MQPSEPDKPCSLPDPTVPGLRVDWGEALATTIFYGREEELARLTQWVVQERCRVVSLLGIGGIGKSALSISLMYRLSEHFQIVIFRSLRDAPSCEALLDDCLQVLSPQEISAVQVNLERRINLLLAHLHKARVLLVLDNLESLVREGDTRGHFRPSFEAYGLLLNRVAEASHQSCVLLTSREKPAELRHLEGRYSQVRSLRLVGLDAAACKQILEEKGIAPGFTVASGFTPEVGTAPEQEQLIEVYSGNPLALKIVAETIVDLFGGQIGAFLAGNKVIFGSITDLLEEQFARLSHLEQSVLCWLAIARELMTLDELLAVLVKPLPRLQVLEAVDSLRRRSLIEPGKRPTSFTLQSVVLEYVTGFLIAEGTHEIEQRCLNRLIQYGLSQATAREYVRQTQERLLVSPLLAGLQSIYPTVGTGQAQGTVPTAPVRSPVEEQLLSLLDELRKRATPTQGYGPANLIALLRLLRGNLNALDLSHLCIRGVYLQDIEMQEASLSYAQIRDCVWTSAIDVAWAVALSGNGKWWASGGIQGQVCVWEGVHPHTLHLAWQAHTDFVYTLAFSPDGRTLASGSQDGTVKLWEVESGALLWTGWQSFPLSLAFSPDGRLLASGEYYGIIRLWDPQSGTPLQTLTHPSDVWAIAWSPDGKLLAGGGTDGEIRLWERQKGTDLADRPHLCLQTNWVSSLAFAPDGRMLASTSWGDQTVKLWEVETHRDSALCLSEAGKRGQLLHTLPGYTDQSRGVAWHPDGRLLAYSNPDKAIQLWDVEASCCRAVLHGHSTDIYGLAFTPDGARLFSGSADGTLRVWDVSDYRCVRVMQGYGVYLYDVAWSPDGTYVSSGDTNGQVTVWDIGGATPPRVLHGHTWIVEAVGWSPDGQYFASCGLDGVLCLWDPTTYTLVQRFENSKILLLSMAWSPNGKQLACGTYVQGIRVWDATTRSLKFVGQENTGTFWGVDWSPSGTQLVGGRNDGCLYLWEYAEGSEQAQERAPLKLLGRHQSRITSAAWSPDGRWLASGSGTTSNGELFVWDVLTGERVQTFGDHPDVVYALTWIRCRDADDPHGDQLVSGGGDGLLRWWDVQSGQCLMTQQAHQGTIRSLKVSPNGKLLASCGDDGAIKIWDLCSGGLAPPLLQTLRHDRPYERLNITGIRGLTEAQKASLRALGAIDEGRGLH